MTLNSKSNVQVLWSFYYLLTPLYYHTSTLTSTLISTLPSTLTSTPYIDKVAA